MASHLYERDGDRFVPSELTTGFWDRDHQAGGPVGALLAHAMERFEPGWTEAEGALLLARATIELVRPVPRKPVTVAVQAFALGRRSHRLDAIVLCEGRELGRASGLRRLTPAPVHLPPGLGADAPPQPPGPESPWQELAVVRPPWPTIDAACELRQVEGRTDGIGPCTMWLRLRSDLIAGEGTTPLARTMVAADWAAGLGGALPTAEYLRPNADLNVHLHRYPVDGWVGVQARMWFSDTGHALGDATLHDRAGTLGRATASVLVSAR